MLRSFDTRSCRASLGLRGRVKKSGREERGPEEKEGGGGGIREEERKKREDKGRKGRYYQRRKGANNNKQRKGRRISEGVGSPCVTEALGEVGRGSGEA